MRRADRVTDVSDWGQHQHLVSHRLALFRRFDLCVRFLLGPAVGDILTDGIDTRLELHAVCHLVEFLKNRWKRCGYLSVILEIMLSYNLCVWLL